MRVLDASVTQATPGFPGVRATDPVARLLQNAIAPGNRRTRAETGPAKFRVATALPLFNHLSVWSKNHAPGITGTVRLSHWLSREGKT
jgi:hypothetical protein